MAAALAPVSGSQLWGGNFVVGRTLYKDPKGVHRWGLFGDLGLNGGSHEDGSVSQQSLLVGGRFSYWLTANKVVLVAGRPEFHPRLQFFLQALGGGVWVKNEFPTLTSSGIQSIADKEFAWSLGGGTGVDFLFSDYGGLRGQVDLVRRLKADEPRKLFFRVSVGVVYRFEYHKPN
jgi:hypothetical protein